MPYEWTAPEERDGAEVLHVWPYRSLPKKGFVLFMGLTFGLFLLPLSAVLGSPVLWGVLPFILGTLALIYGLLMRSYRDGDLIEELTLGPKHMALVRHNPRGPSQHWEANPHWVQVTLHDQAGPVPSYVTLRGAGREVELGAFLTPEEREALYIELQERLNAAR